MGAHNCKTITPVYDARTDHRLTFYRPEKKQLAGYAGLSGAGGAGRESPIGDDDNEEVRQRERANPHSILPLLSHNKLLPHEHHPSTPMHLPFPRRASPFYISMPSSKHAHSLIQIEQRSENNDFCSACQGSGYLLCCDGCDRSFHFTCLDPPINDNAKELDEPWFCYICVANRPAALLSPEKGPTARGIFAPLLHGLRKQNPATFKLPVDLREFFDGVSTDKNGAFVEQLNGKPTRYAPPS